jgi:hypothetical protein
MAGLLAHHMKPHVKASNFRGIKLLPNGGGKIWPRINQVNDQQLKSMTILYLDHPAPITYFPVHLFI